MATSRESKVADNFGTFLSTLNDRSVTIDSGVPSASSQATPEDEASATGTTVPDRAAPNVSLDLVTKAASMLGGANAKSVTDFQAEVGLGFTEFGQLISTLDRLGLVAITGEPGSEAIGLTPQGRIFAQMS